MEGVDVPGDGPVVHRVELPLVHAVLGGVPYGLLAGVGAVPQREGAEDLALVGALARHRADAVDRVLQLAGVGVEAVALGRREVRTLAHAILDALPHPARDPGGEHQNDDREADPGEHTPDHSRSPAPLPPLTHPGAAGTALRGPGARRVRGQGIWTPVPFLGRVAAAGADEEARAGYRTNARMVSGSGQDRKTVSVPERAARGTDMGAGRAWGTK